MSIFITGLGCIGPLGFGTEQTWSNALQASLVLSICRRIIRRCRRACIAIDEGYEHCILNQHHRS